MLFNSSIFLFCFLPFVIIGYYLLKESYRLYFLSLASLLFYAWGEPKHLFVLVLSIAVNYVFGLLIHITLEKQKHIRKVLLIAAILGNLGVLFYFKYVNFTLSGLNRLFSSHFTLHDIILPIGISFFTFKGISYVIDVYKKRVSAEKNPAMVGFYLSFFPQLLAGPIVRYKSVKKQIGKPTVSLEVVTGGAKRFIIGLAKKVILANTLGGVVDQIFANPAVENTAATAWLGILCYTFQIYLDFSAYSDMAIGLGNMFGFRTLENFDYPYIARSLSDFWKRWHITLSTWFRDYVYLPLSSNLVKHKWGVRSIYVVSSLVVWFLTGLWHGASLSFLAWGLWHGLFLVIERTLEAHDPQKKYLTPLKYVITMLIVVVGWVFFRVESLREAFKYIGVMFGLVQPKNVGFTVWYYLDAKVICTLAAAVIVSMPIIKTKLFDALQRHAIWKYAYSVMALILLFVSIVFVMASTYNTFIYFQF